MSGHNKWSKIKRKKEITDAKKGKIFGKLARNIELAAQKGPDSQMNVNLRVAIDQAKSSNMPNVNIERAIKKGSGQDKSAVKLEEKWYEAYGPGGVAILIKTVTNNKNRTVAEIKHILSKKGGNLAESGSVRWQFNEKKEAKFPNSLSKENQAILNSLLDELKEQEDVQDVFTNRK